MYIYIYIYIYINMYIYQSVDRERGHIDSASHSKKEKE